MALGSGYFEGFMQIIIFFCIAFSLAFTSCTDSAELERVLKFDKTAFNEERASWMASGITSYQIIQDYDAGRGTYNSPVKLTITSGAMTGIALMDPPDPGEEPVYYADTIEAVFSRIEEEFENDKKLFEDPNSKLIHVAVKITYNKTYHFPQMISYSRGFSEDSNADSVWTLEQRQFTISD